MERSTPALYQIMIFQTLLNLLKPEDADALLLNPRYAIRNIPSMN
jgi:hypothetical protein